MCSKTGIRRYMKDCSGDLERLLHALQDADAVVIGAGSGLSVSAGFTYSGERFEGYFSDFIQEYHMPDMYSGGFWPYETLEEYWAWWSRHVFYNRYVDAPKPVYDKLLDLVRDKDYFVITTNVDHQFQKAGFDKRRLFYMQGDYGLWQCGEPCHQKTYDNEAVIREMVGRQKGRKVPTELIPYCPVCGKPMTMNLRCDGTFVEDDGWHEAEKHYDTFIGCHGGMRILYLELGVGANTPVWIKYPFWKMTAENSNAIYACINDGEAVAPAEIGHQSICINADIGEILEELSEDGIV